ncbi:enoyl-CoA hydratase/isomerase family protein (plasmid) [Paraburkholderia sprentiae WSM5005]|uniref:Enoyl-CoA hydratase/isomerase family protein n=1 Tax=Paraburkholderia sprentiae WSM5005 TaxID=754502 RepID=A0A1I9YWI6_9BURK|nr:3-hydroxyacyl-CoA dehydrogenase NAD-binding domain-containing protein [Paraburkholderia sprentiae]APA90566.1 enoyl-CoA hydratase/isomerase family protein [Paraburkholderia sprentiae WSM5005]
MNSTQKRPSDVVRFEARETLGVVLIDSPPLNVLTGQVIAGLADALDAFERDRSLRALVVCCAGRTFVVGGDLHALDSAEFTSAPYNHILARLESCDRPVFCALHGNVLGGGLELALACHYRVALVDTRLGLPEIKIGVLPGSLGTQRLPRLIPAQDAISMMLSGQAIDARAAFKSGLIDLIDEVHPNALESGVRFAEAQLSRGAGARPTRALPVKAEGLPRDYFTKKLAEAEKSPVPAARAIVECVQVAVEDSFDVGEQLEALRFDQCRRSKQSTAMRHVFFAEREARQVPGIGAGTDQRVLRKIGVVGAGTMGAGIAMNFMNIGIPTVLLETRQELLDKGLANIRATYNSGVKKGRLDETTARRRLECLEGTLQEGDLADCDLVIEAVFEDLELKQSLMRRLGRICRQGAILATNTSTLDVDAIALASGRASDVVGLHFFSPAHVMRLLEVVRGARTSPDVLATTVALAGRLGKVPVVSGVCYGFVGNRMAEPYMREAEFLLLEGATPQQIDDAVQDVLRLGMAMGPCRMLDLAGIDVGAKTLIELGKQGGLPPDPSYRVVCQQLFRDGRWGQKTGSGYYRYVGRAREPEPLTSDVCEILANEFDIRRGRTISDGEICERLMLPLINEGFRILEEEIAMRPGDIDVVWTAGYGFPAHRGGPMWMANAWGLPNVLDRIQHYQRTLGNRFGYWTPAKLLVELAQQGATINRLAASKAGVA